MTSTSTLPSGYRFAFAVARKWQGVPEKNEDGTPMTDEQVIAGGFLTPEMIEAIMLIINQLLTRCLDPERQRAWRRVRGYMDTTNQFTLVGDNVLLLRACDSWLGKLAFPRRGGDAKALRYALVETARGLDQEGFEKLHNESMFLAI